ncbi:MAG: hypothetical protein ACHQF4_02360 [Sphingobacteriales bacterium]
MDIKNSWQSVSEKPDTDRKVLAINNYGAAFVVWWDEFSGDWVKDGITLTFHKGMFLEYWQDIILPNGMLKYNNN